MNRKSELHGRVSGLGRGFTLVELLVVVSIIALLIAILLPSLKKAREQTKTVVCLTRCKALGAGVMTYATEYDGKLPGPLHPAVYRNQTLETTSLYARDRQLTWVIAQAMGQRGGGRGKENVTDDVATCPSMESILSEEHFVAWKNANPTRPVAPTHYALNNYGSDVAESGSLDTDPRKTNPPAYFGYSPPPPGTTGTIKSPVALSRIPRTSDEWMIADAWYRTSRIGGSGIPALFKQHGPYQSDWSGEALPFQPPHRSRDRVVVTVDATLRDTLAAQQSKKKRDGATNAVYFDGHAETVQSKTLMGGGREIMYGFPGTVNPDLRALSRAQQDQVKTFQWQ